MRRASWSNGSDRQCASGVEVAGDGETGVVGIGVGRLVVADCVQGGRQTAPRPRGVDTVWIVKA